MWSALRSYCMQHHLGTLATKAIHVLKYLSCSSEINSCSLSLLCCTYNLNSCSACFYMLWSSSKASSCIGEERKIIPIDSICAQSTLPFPEMVPGFWITLFFIVQLSSYMHWVIFISVDCSTLINRMEIILFFLKHLEICQLK